MLIGFQDLCEMFVESPEVQDTGETVGVCSGLKALELIAPARRGVPADRCAAGSAPRRPGRWTAPR